MPTKSHEAVFGKEDTDALVRCWRTASPEVFGSMARDLDIPQVYDEVLIAIFARDDITKHPDTYRAVKDEICQRGLYVKALGALGAGTPRHRVENDAPIMKCACCGAATVSMAAHMEECPGMIRIHIRPNPHVVCPPASQRAIPPTAIDCPALGAACSVPLDHNFRERLMPHRGAPLCS